jgi:hypothetical protein
MAFKKEIKINGRTCEYHSIVEIIAIHDKKELNVVLNSWENEAIKKEDEAPAIGRTQSHIIPYPDAIDLSELESTNGMDLQWEYAYNKLSELPEWEDAEKV